MSFPTQQRAPLRSLRSQITGTLPCRVRVIGLGSRTAALMPQLAAAGTSSGVLFLAQAGTLLALSRGALCPPRPVGFTFDRCCGLVHTCAHSVLATTHCVQARCTLRTLEQQPLIRVGRRRLSPAALLLVSPPSGVSSCVNNQRPACSSEWTYQLGAGLAQLTRSSRRMTLSHGRDSAESKLYRTHVCPFPAPGAVSRLNAVDWPRQPRLFVVYCYSDCLGCASGARGRRRRPNANANATPCARARSHSCVTVSWSWSNSRRRS